MYDNVKESIVERMKAIIADNTTLSKKGQSKSLVVQHIKPFFKDSSVCRA